MGSLDGLVGTAVTNPAFIACVKSEVADLQRRVVAGYASPPLGAVRAAVDAALSRRGLIVSAVVFWGRPVYADILWMYLQRNLRVNGGIVDDVLFVVRKGAETAVLNAALAAYPTVVRSAPLPPCERLYNCVYSSLLTDERALYVKFDDDIVFIKDGTFEHLAYQVWWQVCG